MNFSFEQWIIIFDTLLKYLVAISGVGIAGGLYLLAKDRATFYKERMERAEKEVKEITIKSEEERQKYVQVFKTMIAIQEIDIENITKAKLNEPTKISSSYGLASALPINYFGSSSGNGLGKVRL